MKHPLFYQAISRALAILTLLILAACSVAPAAPIQTTTSLPISTSTPPSTTVAQLDSVKPNDQTEARLRVSQCVFGVPDMDVYMNGTVPVIQGSPILLAAGEVSGYQFLTPGTVRVAVGSGGKGIDQAFFAPLDVTVEAGHRYTVVILGQAEDTNHPALVINETKAYEQAGGTPSSTGHITVNNVKGAAALSFLQDGLGEKDVPFGGFGASAHTAGNFKSFTVSVGDKVLEDNGAGSSWNGTDNMDCFSGSYSSTGDTHDTHTSMNTSGLNTIDYLQGLSTEHTTVSSVPSFATFLAAVKTAGLTDLLTTGGPHLVFVPSDEAFAALSKDQLAALMADPKALANFLQAYIVAGFYPSGTLGHGGFDRTVTNLLGKPLVLFGQDDNFNINGVNVGLIDTTMVANGTRYMLIKQLIEPAAK